MHLDDFVHRVLPTIGPLALIFSVARLRRSSHSATLLVCGLSLAVTLAASLVSAWLGLRFDESHDLPDWYGPLYWWSTQWVAPPGYAVAGLSLLAYSMREALPRGGAMRASTLDAGFSVADTSHPTLASGEGWLTASFSSSSSQPVLVEFSKVAAFHWHESPSDRLLEGERYDGVSEIFGSQWLAQHSPGRTMNSVAGLRHIRLNFNECGCLEVLCTAFARRE